MPYCYLRVNLKQYALTFHNQKLHASESSMANQSSSKISQSATVPKGFQFAGITCGIKASGKPDLALIVGDEPLVSAGVYTTNQIVAAPVLLCRQRTPASKTRAVVINSGNANACTGDQGDRDADEMTQLVASQVGCRAVDVLVMSTGIIGRSMPMEKLKSGIPVAVKSLAPDHDAFVRASTAIMTTDAFRKSIQRTILIDGQSYCVAAMAKGAGMIAPNMATMLAVVATDAPLDQDDVVDALRYVANRSFNRVSVDGHTSTNDSLVLLSSGAAGGERLTGDRLEKYREFLCETCIELAKMLVADGEGATHIMEMRISGAESDADANEIARVIGESLLVKTAITGGDPNWGRIVSAAGYAGRPIKAALTSLKLLGVTLYEHGTPLSFDAKAVSQLIRETSTIVIELSVGDGPGQATRWASDITTEYVRFNSEYTT